MKHALAMALSGLLLTGCGDSESTPTTPSPTPSPAPAPAPAANPARLDLSASPTRLLASGSTVTVTVRLTDAAGAPLAGRTIQLATANGTLSATLPVTGQNGEATATLTGSASTTVLASAAGLNASLDVPAVSPFVLTLDSKYSVIAPGDTDEMYVTLTQVQGFPNAPTPSSIMLSCGNGDTITLGDQRTANCRYRDRGTYVATVTATAAGGYSTSASTTVSVEPAPITMTLTAREVGRDANTIEVELRVVGAPDRAVCSWDPGNGSKPIGACNQNVEYTSGDISSSNTVTARVVVDPKTGLTPVSLELTFNLKF